MDLNRACRIVGSIESFAPSQPFNASYGYLWWLNGQESFMLPGPTPPARPGSLIPTAPADLVAALGKADQKLYISRALDLVVARLGDKADPESRPALVDVRRRALDDARSAAVRRGVTLPERASACLGPLLRSTPLWSTNDDASLC